MWENCPRVKLKKNHVSSEPLGDRAPSRTRPASYPFPHQTLTSHLHSSLPSYTSSDTCKASHDVSARLPHHVLHPHHPPHSPDPHRVDNGCSLQLTTTCKDHTLISYSLPRPWPLTHSPYMPTTSMPPSPPHTLSFQPHPRPGSVLSIHPYNSQIQPHPLSHSPIDAFSSPTSIIVWPEVPASSTCSLLYKDLLFGARFFSLQIDNFPYIL